MATAMRKRSLDGTVILGEGKEDHHKAVRAPYTAYKPSNLPPLSATNLSPPLPPLSSFERPELPPHPFKHPPVPSVALMMASRRSDLKCKPGMPRKFTGSGKPRANMVGNIGLASEAKYYLRLDNRVPLDGGKEGQYKWEHFRTFIKDLSGNKLKRSQYNDSSFRQLYETCARHAFLEPLRDVLLSPQTYANKKMQDSLVWAIQDAWKKKRNTKKTAGEINDDTGEDLDVDDGQLETPASRRRRIISPISKNARAKTIDSEISELSVVP
jgi:hypothetical protein